MARSIVDRFLEAPEASKVARDQFNDVADRMAASRTFGIGINQFSAVATVICVGAFLIGPLEHPPGDVFKPVVVLELLGMGLSALVGQLFLTLAFSHGAPAKVSVVGLTQIVFTMALSRWLFDHPVNELALVGTVLVIAPYFNS
jgi:drug/metabolite transporter (DMT)-like permease